MIRILVALISVSFSNVFSHANDTTTLSSVVRHLILKHLPTPAITTQKNWDKQKEVVVRLNPEREGRLKWKLNTVKEKQNDGLWSRISVTIVEPQKKLAIDLKDIATSETGKTTFRAALAAPVTFKLEQQLWKSGLRLYSGETRGHCEVKVILNCESASKTDWAPGKLLPTQLFRVSITRADVSYDHFKVEHAVGVGGESAEVIGETVIAAIKLLKPNLETDLIERINSAIVKAGQSKEIRVDFEKLLVEKK